MEKLHPQLTHLRTFLTNFKEGRFPARNKQDVINKAARLTAQARIAHVDGILSRLELDGMLITIDEACIAYFTRLNEMEAQHGEG